MPQHLWTAFIAANGSNEILVDSSPDGTKWTGSRFINQWSPYTPALACFNNTLYIAFITNDIDSATGVPSNRIFVCSTTDGVSWSPATFIQQYSKCAPALAVWGSRLCIAFVANDSTNRILFCSFTEPSGWSGNTDTGQASPCAPALAQFGDNLQMVFVSDDSRHAILRCDIGPGGTWGGASDTGQSTKCAPALAVFDTRLYVAFVANDATNHLLLASSHDWSATIQMHQASPAAPGLAVFGSGESGLYAGFPGNSAGAACRLTSATDPASASGWPSHSTDIQQSTRSGMALATAPFACCAQMVPAPKDVGGAHNYFVWAGPCPSPPALTSLELTVLVSTAVRSTNGFSIQWNCWSPLGEGIKCAWQQYGFTIDADGYIDYYLENWPAKNFKTVDGQALAGNIVDYRTNITLGGKQYHWYLLPTPALPAGYTLKMKLLYAANSPAVAGIVCSVIDENNHVVAQSDDVLLTSLPIDTKSHDPVKVPTDALTPVVGFQLAVVGIVNDAVAQFVSGQGTLVVSSPHFPLIAVPKRPTCITEFPGTGENSNCSYAPLPDGHSRLMVQPFNCMGPAA